MFLDYISVQFQLAIYLKFNYTVWRERICDVEKFSYDGYNQEMDRAQTGLGQNPFSAGNIF